jgi:DNA mismatch endonuclease, patch repair protein
MPMKHPLPLDEKTQRRMEMQLRKDTHPELAVRNALRSIGARYRITPPDLPGSPDVANKSGGWAIFVHGCYWHQHLGCHRATIPINNREWWVSKFEKNKNRDSKKIADLKAAGFRVLVVWECETTHDEALKSRLVSWLEKGDRDGQFFRRDIGLP